MKYLISQGLLHPPLEVELEAPPPCLYCGEPVLRPSMDGPLVCACCDCGCNHDGTRWTPAQCDERYAHRSAKVAEYRERAEEKKVS